MVDLRMVASSGKDYWKNDKWIPVFEMLNSDFTVQPETCIKHLLHYLEKY